MDSRDRARAEVADKILEAVRRRDFRNAIPETASGGNHVVVAALPDDPMGMFFDQARESDGPIYIALLERQDLSIIGLSRRPAPKHRALGSDEGDCPIHQSTHVGMVLSYLRAAGRPVDVVEIAGSVLVELIDDPNDLTPVRG